MILAHDLRVGRVTVPERMKAASRGQAIDVLDRDVPFGADDWIACAYSLPHDDADQYPDELFLTLTVTRSEHHVVGDAYGGGPVPRGTLFVVDPLVKHWLIAERYGDTFVKCPWVGVQWKVRREDAAVEARRIVNDLHGRWLQPYPDRMDKRYLSWVQQGEKP